MVLALGLILALTCHAPLASRLPLPLQRALAPLIAKLNPSAGYTPAAAEEKEANEYGNAEDEWEGYGSPKTMPNGLEPPPELEPSPNGAQAI